MHLNSEGLKVAKHVVMQEKAMRYSYSFPNYYSIVKHMVHFVWVDGVIVRCESINEVIETMTAAQEA